MKTILKIGCGVLLALGVLGIIAVVLIGQCLPSAPEAVTPSPEPLPPAPEKTTHKIIEDLSYIKVIGLGYSADADPEKEGVKIRFLWYDSKSELIYFRNVPMRASIEIFTYEMEKANKTFEEIKKYVTKHNK